MKLTTWNVNGIRACLNKGLRTYIETSDVDVICLQETKACAEDVDLSWLGGRYQAVWNAATKKGYSGTLTLSRVPFLTASLGMSFEEHDGEGRMVTLEYPDFYLINVYTPNAKTGLIRLPYRMEWDNVFRTYSKKLAERKGVLICGDLNCAHEEIDLANPKSNRKNAGFSDEERASFSEHLQAGFLDVFRLFDPNPGRYTWWTMRTGGSAREKNIGWRIDYWLASEQLRTRLRSCTIRSDIYGSDHCPVELVID